MCVSMIGPAMLYRRLSFAMELVQTSFIGCPATWLNCMFTLVMRLWISRVERLQLFQAGCTPKAATQPVVSRIVLRRLASVIVLRRQAYQWRRKVTSKSKAKAAILCSMGESKVKPRPRRVARHGPQPFQWLL